MLGDVVVKWEGGWIDKTKGITSSRGVTRFGLGKASAVQIQQLSQFFSPHKSAGGQGRFIIKIKVLHGEMYGAVTVMYQAVCEVFLSCILMW